MRRVSNAGCFRLSSEQVFLSQALNGEYIALEEIEDGVWNILFYSTLLGRFDQATGKITGADFRASPLRSEFAATAAALGPRLNKAEKYD